VELTPPLLKFSSILILIHQFIKRQSEKQLAKKVANLSDKCRASIPKTECMYEVSEIRSEFEYFLDIPAEQGQNKVFWLKRPYFFKESARNSNHLMQNCRTSSQLFLLATFQTIFQTDWQIKIKIEDRFLKAV